MKVFISAIQFFLRKILSNLGIFSIVLPSSNGRGLGLLLTGMFPLLSLKILLLLCGHGRCLFCL
ncbi:hypothetical protein ES288_A08G062500v1 [Gossypium darwinii]|uniref:Uncharacterized protein n=1 Tax=Gossypium darwinii TaxID=34276 RepID=A0A5D2FIM3_GOSDA|nr:hypothetical protein ES288_A08G062500v1 [Gossypium darwinii]